MQLSIILINLGRKCMLSWWWWIPGLILLQNLIQLSNGQVDQKRTWKETRIGIKIGKIVHPEEIQYGFNPRQLQYGFNPRQLQYGFNPRQLRHFAIVQNKPASILPRMPSLVPGVSRLALVSPSMDFSDPYLPSPAFLCLSTPSHLCPAITKYIKNWKNISYSWQWKQYLFVYQNHIPGAKHLAQIRLINSYWIWWTFQNYWTFISFIYSLYGAAGRFVSGVS